MPGLKLYEATIDEQSIAVVIAREVRDHWLAYFFRLAGGEMPSSLRPCDAIFAAWIYPHMPRRDGWQLRGTVECEPSDWPLPEFYEAGTQELVTYEEGTFRQARRPAPPDVAGTRPYTDTAVRFKLREGQATDRRRDYLKTLPCAEFSVRWTSPVERSAVPKIARSEVSRASFWKLVDSVRAKAGDDDVEFLKLLRAQLESQSADDIAAFAGELRRAVDDAYRNDMWGAAWVLQGGGSDDQFFSFRHLARLAGPRALRRGAERPRGSGGFCGARLPRPRGVRLRRRRRLRREGPDGDLSKHLKSPSKPKGKDWDEETVEQQFPRLAKYADDA